MCRRCHFCPFSLALSFTLPATACRYAAAACDGEAEAEGGEEYLSEGLQIVGMSATLPNIECLAK